MQSQQHKYSMMEFESNKTMWLSQVNTAQPLETVVTLVNLICFRGDLMTPVCSTISLTR